MRACVVWKLAPGAWLPYDTPYIAILCSWALIMFLVTKARGCMSIPCFVYEPHGPTTQGSWGSTQG